MIDTLLFSLSSVSALMGLVYLIIRIKRALHYCAAAAYLAQAGALCLRWLGRRGLDAAAAAEPAAILFLAPSLYLASVMLLKGDRKLSQRQLLHYAAPLAASLLLAGGAFGFAGPAQPLLGAAASLALAGYLLGAVLRNLRSLRRLEGRAREELRTFLGFSLVLAALSILLGAARLAGDERLYIWGLLAFSVDTMAFTLARVRNPSLAAFGLQDRQPSRRRGLADPRKALDLEGQARRLMEEERLYARPDLTLDLMAHEMGAPASQLSELLNSAMKTNFRAFVNEYRLRAVMRDLVERPEASILDIAFDNGFNSKTSFNTLFSRAAGCSPREYRKRQAGQS